MRAGSGQLVVRHSALLSEVEQAAVRFERAWLIHTVTGPNVPKLNYKYKDVQHLLEGESQVPPGKALSLFRSLSLSLFFFLSVSSISVWGEGLFC